MTARSMKGRLWTTLHSRTIPSMVTTHFTTIRPSISRSRAFSVYWGFRPDTILGGVIVSLNSIRTGADGGGGGLPTMPPMTPPWTPPTTPPSTPPTSPSSGGSSFGSSGGGCSKTTLGATSACGTTGRGFGFTFGCVERRAAGGGGGGGGGGIGRRTRATSTSVPPFIAVCFVSQTAATTTLTCITSETVVPAPRRRAGRLRLRRGSNIEASVISLRYRRGNHSI